LLGHTVGFVQALRQAGLPVSLAESLDSVRALGAVPALDREAWRAGLAAATVKQRGHRAAFDVLFDLWFPALMGSPGAYGEQVAPDSEPRDSDQVRDELRQRLAQLLREGDLAALRRLAGEAVGLLGRVDAAPGQQSFFAYRVLRELSPDTLIATLVAALLGDRPREGLDEALARQVVTERLAAFRGFVDDEVRRRLAEQRGRGEIARTSVRPLVENVDFMRARTDDVAALRRTVHPLARRLATRLAARRHAGRTGRLDFRRTIRSSLASGGVPLETRHRPRRPHKPELLVLCDVSGSVASFAQFTLLLAYALQEQFTRVRAFAFIDTCDEVTEYFERAGDVGDALDRMGRQARVVWFDGHSDYGHSFGVFAERYANALTPRASLLVLGDARNNYRDPGLPVLRRIVRDVRHAYWLNPEPRATWGTGDSLAPRYAEVLEMVECRNVAQLERFVRRLLPA
jgi:uncharacterized protein with von Willebrand factor type A (vWA) domain